MIAFLIVAAVIALMIMAPDAIGPIIMLALGVGLLSIVAVALGVK